MWAVLDGDGTVGVNGGESSRQARTRDRASTHPGAYSSSIEHERHTAATLELASVPASSCLATVLHAGELSA